MSGGAFKPLPLTQSDLNKARELKRTKALAAASLVVALILLIVAKYFERRYPAFAYLAAFAEAAVIGGLADWYAVVALFRHPMGIPIPHTAIVPKNKDRIAEKLGEFIENHFLTSEAVEAKLKSINFAAFIADWLRDRKKSAELSRFLLRLLPDAVSAAENSGLGGFLSRRVMAQIESIDVAPLAVGTLRSFLKERRHQQLLDEVMAGLLGSLENPEMLAALREKIRGELPSLLNLYRADAFLLKRIVNTAAAFFAEVREDPDHPFRDEFDRMVAGFVDRMESDPAFREKLQSAKNDLLARPELNDLARHVWANLRQFLERNADGESGVLRQHLTNAFVEVGNQLAADEDMRGEINAGAVVVLKSFVTDQKKGVSTFISDQVKSWDLGQLVTLIELNIGKDLQYIRFNGMIIGGLAGLALHVLKGALALQ